VFASLSPLTKHLNSPIINYQYIPRGSRGSVVGLRPYATSRNVAGSITDEVIEFFS
jgi:hypothetical protein